MVFCIIQIGMMPVSIGVIIFIWSAADTTTAILLTIWMLFIGIIDNILKPIMMSIGAPAPMLVVFMGTIGGFIYNGFIGKNIENPIAEILYTQRQKATLSVLDELIRLTSDVDEAIRIEKEKRNA